MLKPFVTIAAPAFLMMLPGVADAHDWYVVSTAAGDESATFVDRASIAENPDGTVNAIVYTVLAANKDNGAAAYQYTAAFNCASKEAKFVHLTVFDATDKPIVDKDGSGQWRPAGQGTQTEMTLRYACSKGTDPAEAKSGGAKLTVPTARALLASAAKDG